MNDGYIAIWFITMAVILYMTGWNEQISDQLSRRNLSFFLMSVYVLQLFEIKLSAVLSIQTSAVLAVAVAIFTLLSLRRASTVMFTMACSAMIGMIWLWMRFMYASDPVFILLHPQWDGPLIAGILSGLLCDRFRTQFAAIVLASTMSELYTIMHPLSGLHHHIVGDLAWWDGLAIALAAARVISNLKGWLHPKSIPLLEDPFGQKREN